MYYVIVNGKSADNGDLRHAVERARGAGHEVAVRVTWEGGDAARFAGEAVALGADVVVAAGGDGTINEVASALACHDADADALPSLGVVPLGTANDFAHGAHLPLEVGPAVDLVLASTPTPIDLLRVLDGERTRWCVNLASGGFGTEVTVHTDPQLKERLGGLSYVLTGISKLCEVSAAHGSVRGEGFDWAGDVIALGLGNGPQAGGGQVLCPHAKLNDGLIEATIVPAPSAEGDVLGLLGTAFAEGSAAALHALATTARSPWFELSAPAPFTLNLDGEPATAPGFRVEAVSARLRVHLPADCPLL